MPRGRTPKASKETWATAALGALTKGGVQAVRVEPIAKQLGVTKGSFYWHFDSRDQLIAAALEVWETRGTALVLEQAATIADPLQRVQSLFDIAFSVRGAGSLLIHLAADAQHPLVAPVLARVTERRVAFIGEQFLALGLPPVEAERRAILCYSLYVGTFTVHASKVGIMPDGEQRRAYIEHLVRTLVPPG